MFLFCPLLSHSAKRHQISPVVTLFDETFPPGIFGFVVVTFFLVVDVVGTVTNSKMETVVLTSLSKAFSLYAVLEYASGFSSAVLIISNVEANSKITVDTFNNMILRVVCIIRPRDSGIATLGAFVSPLFGGS